MFEKVKEILEERYSGKEVKMETKIIEDLEADSLDLVELVMDLEDELGVSINDEDLPNLKTVGDIVKYAEAQQ